jgi:hypothetical protein
MPHRHTAAALQLPAFEQDVTSPPRAPWPLVSNGTTARTQVGANDIFARADVLPRLSALERRVVLLSRRDRMPAGPIGQFAATLARRLFGLEPANPLADARLEALRRFAIALRLGGGEPSERELAGFVAAGYDPRLSGQIFDLCGERSIARQSAAERNRRLAVMFAVWMGVLPPMAIEMADYFEDGMLGAMVAGLVFASFSPMLGRIR